MVKETFLVRISILVEEIVIFGCEMYTKPKTRKIPGHVFLLFGYRKYSVVGVHLNKLEVSKESLFLF